jgi:hypothetical protein
MIAYCAVIVGCGIDHVFSASARDNPERLISGDRRHPRRRIGAGAGSRVTPGSQQSLLGRILGEVAVEEASGLSECDDAEAPPVPRRRVLSRGRRELLEFQWSMLIDETI